jgi:transcriptional regulator with XRE-family HTH domain
MGRRARRIPARLGEKLLQVRYALELSQDDMLTRLGLVEECFRSSVSSYERGSEPELQSLLIYARLAGIPVEVLIDDDLELPRALKAAAKRRAALVASRRRKK